MNIDKYIEIFGKDVSLFYIILGGAFFLIGLLWLIFLIVYLNKYKKIPEKKNNKTDLKSQNNQTPSNSKPIPQKLVEEKQLNDGTKAK